MFVKQIKNILPNSSARYLKKIYLSVRGTYYYGNKYECNICKHSFRKMLQGGFDLPIIKDKIIVGAGLRNHICPYCQSTDRDRLVQLFFETSKILDNGNQKLLHIAPEPSLYSIINKKENIKYIPAVKYHEGIYYPKNISIVDITDLYFNNGEFDIIICNHVLEHIENDKLALSEIFRVLRKGGTAILQIPYSTVLNETYENAEVKTVSQREAHFGQFDHVRLYGNDFSKILEDSGFKVELFNPKTVLNGEKIKKLSLFVNENLFVAIKP